jgi:hypothetical protein
MSQYASYTGFFGGTAGASGITTINGENGPAIDISAGPGISIATLADNITISTTSASLGTALDIFVDANNGSDATGTGTVTNPVQTIDFAQTLFSDQASNKPYTLRLQSGFYPMINPLKQFVNLVGLGIDITVVDTVVINYGGADDFEQLLVNLFIITLDIERIALQTLANAFFTIQNCGLGDVTMVGAGDNVSFDVMDMNWCIVVGNMDMHATNHNARSSNIGFIQYDGVGVDGTLTGTSVQNWLNTRVSGNVDITGFMAVHARSSSPNRVRLHGTDSLYSGDICSYPISTGPNGVQLLTGATLAQVEFYTISPKLLVPTAAFDDGYTIRPFIDANLYSAPAAPIPLGITLPDLSAGNPFGSANYSIQDDVGDAATNPITVSSGPFNFSTGLTTDVIKFDNSKHDYKLFNNKWDVGPVSRMGDQMYGSLIVGDGTQVDTYLSGLSKYVQLNSDDVSKDMAVDLVGANSTVTLYAQQTGTPSGFVGSVNATPFIVMANNKSQIKVDSNGTVLLGKVDGTAATPADAVYVHGDSNSNSNSLFAVFDDSSNDYVFQLTTNGGGGFVTAKFSNLANIDAGSVQINNVSNPSAAQDAATKDFVEHLLAKRATLWRDEMTVLVGNPFAELAISSAFYNVVVYQNPEANGDSASSSISIQAGTYILSVMGSMASDRGIVDWYLDGVLIPAGTGQDWYSAAPAISVVQSFSVVIASAGYHVLKYIVNGKNVASTSYIFESSKLWIKPATD